MYKIKKRVPRKHLYRTIQAQQRQLEQLARIAVEAKYKYNLSFQWRRLCAWLGGQA